MSVTEFSAAQRGQMLALARDAIAVTLQGGWPELLPVDQLPEWLRPLRACFVTLESHARLRGCIGSLEAHRPLGHDIILNAVNAATRDFRFAPLRPDEPLPVASEAELLSVLRTGEDGLVLQAGEHRATFLPAVWESLPTPERFLAELKRKAGLPSHYWSDAIRFWRYHTESFGEEREVAIGASGKR
jgi:AmmeMemoRadiSam system protein A